MPPQQTVSPLTSHRWPQASRRAATILEAMISFTLLSTVLAFAAPLIVKHQRLLTAQRDYRLALDEVSNQLERLSAVPDSELSAALEQLHPSEFISEKLYGVKLDSRIDSVDVGRRLTVRLSWGASDLYASTVALAAWRPQADVKEPSRRAEP